MSSLSQTFPRTLSPFVGHGNTMATTHRFSSADRAAYSSREASASGSNTPAAFAAKPLAPPPPAHVVGASFTLKGRGRFQDDSNPSRGPTETLFSTANPGLAPANDDGVVRKGRGLFRADEEDDYPSSTTAQKGRGQSRADNEGYVLNAERRRVVDLGFINQTVQAAAAAPTSHQTTTSTPEYSTAPRTPDPSVVRKGRGQFRAYTVDFADVNDYGSSIAIKGRGQYTSHSHMSSY
ncbi:hypothetical protein IAT38_000112 [Cryptococcus sp. DSM 104549]